MDQSSLEPGGRLNGGTSCGLEPKLRMQRGFRAADSPGNRTAALVMALGYMTLSLGAGEDAHMIRLALLVFSALAFIWFCEELGVVLGSSARTVAALGWVLLVFPALAYAVAVIAAALG